MNANLTAKAEVVKDVKAKLTECKSLVIVDFRGLTVDEATALRAECRKAGVDLKVLKNTLVERAASELGISGLEQYLKGPSAFAFGTKDPVAPAKVLTEYIKKAKKMTVKCGLVDGKVIDAAGVEALASLPPREVLIAKMLGSMNAPITGLVTVLGGTVRKLLYTLVAIKDQKAEA